MAFLDILEHNVPHLGDAELRKLQFGAHAGPTREERRTRATLQDELISLLRRPVAMQKE